MIGIAAAIILFAYIFGSVPFGLVISKLFFKADIRKFGSGNIGATNMFRAFGPVAGAAVLACDFLKGFIPVIIVDLAFPSNSAFVLWVGVAAGLAAILGHSYSIFLKFSGGKGMSTAGGMVTGLWPITIPILVIVWIALIAITRYVSLASIIAAIMLPVLVSFIYPRKEFIIFSIIAAIVVIYRHRSNIGRLLNGTELRIDKKVTLEED
ncbi:MAG TPA: glycerol-3-phosphate 1-O-acyltransferase PlsY [Candidatus Aquicultor sp.]